MTAAFIWGFVTGGIAVPAVLLALGVWSKSRAARKARRDEAEQEREWHL